MNTNKTEYMCFKWEGVIFTLIEEHLKLVDKFTYLGSSVSSTESDVNIFWAKAWNAINRLSTLLPFLWIKMVFDSFHSKDIFPPSDCDWSIQQWLFIIASKHTLTILLLFHPFLQPYHFSTAEGHSQFH